MLLSVNNLEVSYGAIAALQGVSVSIDQGEIVALIGANGAGKTTLLRTISGLLKAKGGSVLWEGKKELRGLAAHEVVGLGISHVPEGRQIFPHLSVRENLMLGGIGSGRKGCCGSGWRGFSGCFRCWRSGVSSGVGR